jgi:autotransporter-associated beta strand protein
MRVTSVRRSKAVRSDFSRRGFRWVLPLLLVALALIAPRAATASTYRWHTAANGNWNDPANWTLVSGPAGTGYPNGSGDTAQFDPPPVMNYTVTIPDGVTVTVERISFPAQNFVTIAGAGSGLLVLETAGADVQIGSTATFGLTFDVPILLKSNLLVTSAASVTFSRAVSDDGTPRSVTMAGHNAMRYTGTVSNTYTGTTTVQRGRLELGKTNGAIAIAGPSSSTLPVRSRRPACAGWPARTWRTALLSG